ncbi:MAG: hypothetical protein KDI98_08290 [Hyphomicrobiaceae bacterium]|nr:hypothetical protein [Hyphomicrobiaceae bacterium]
MEPGIARGPSLPVATTAGRPREEAAQSAPMETAAAVKAAESSAQSHAKFSRETVREPRFREIVEEQAAATRQVVERDAASKSPVFRLIDTTSGNVKHQYPNDSILKLRAYVSQATKTWLENKVRRDV